MNNDVRGKVSKLFGAGEDKESTGEKVKKMYNTSRNPFLDQNGEVFNKYIDYQKVIDRPDTNEKVREYITAATGYVPSRVYTQQTESPSKSTIGADFTFNAGADENGLAGMDVATELPKLTSAQIKNIIGKHFSKSKVISPSDADGIYKAQQNTGMSALAILGIGALESGWGTSSIANKTNNLWGYGATNKNPAAGAHRYSPISDGAEQFATEYMKTYYNGYGAKSIYSAGTGSNPGKKGYAYNDDGSISTSWANNVGSIMKNLYQTAKSTEGGTASVNQSSTGAAGSVGKKIANTASYQNSAATGQCVWYARGRMKEKLGKDIGALGNANEIWYNAKPSAQVKASTDSIRPNMLVTYKTGTSAAGAKYGHAIYIEDVVGDTVYYTEGGSAYHKNGTDGVVKTATRQGILNGVNTSGGRMGSGCIGFVDLEKY